MAWLLPMFKRHFHNWLLLPGDPGHTVSLAVHWSRGISYSSVFAIGESPYGCVAAHPSQWLNKVLVYNVFSDSTTVQTTGEEPKVGKSKVKMGRQDQFKKSKQLSIMNSDVNYL